MDRIGVCGRRRIRRRVVSPVRRARPGFALPAPTGPMLREFFLGWAAGAAHPVVQAEGGLGQLTPAVVFLVGRSRRPPVARAEEEPWVLGPAIHLSRQLPHYRTHHSQRAYITAALAACRRSGGRGWASPFPAPAGPTRGYFFGVGGRSRPPRSVSGRRGPGPFGSSGSPSCQSPHYRTSPNAERRYVSAASCAGRSVGRWGTSWRRAGRRRQCTRRQWRSRGRGSRRARPRQRRTLPPSAR